jgi:hypothetical protein
MLFREIVAVYSEKPYGTHKYTLCVKPDGFTVIQFSKIYLIAV